MQEPLATFVNVIVPLHLPQTYTYRVMSGQEALIARGKRVAVQFGSKKIYAAIVDQIHHTPPEGYAAKYILDVLDDEPTLDDKALAFWHWMANYYMCTLGDVMQAAMPSALKPQSKTYVLLTPDARDILEQTELSDKEHLIVDALLINENMFVDDVTELVQLKNTLPLLKSLYTKGIIYMQEDLKEGYKPKTVTCIALHPHLEEDEAKLKQVFEELEKKEPQLNLLLALLHLKTETANVDKKILLRKSAGSESTLNTLVKKGIFIKYDIAIDRLNYDSNSAPETFTLNDIQQEAYHKIKDIFDNKDVVLLHGVTSSGKTHVYVKLIEEQLALGKQVLLLAPEIALTSQMISRVTRYFGEAAISYHSRYNQQERVEIWNKVKSNEVKIIIGARSSIFLPFHQLGLIIVDEEHDQSYKQSDPAPRYQARDASVILANIHHCKVLMGSATPAFETYYNAQQGKYGLVRIEQRHGNIAMPLIETANIAEDKRTKQLTGSFSALLMQHMKKALHNKEQVILFQNRRGYAPIYECSDCHHVVKCRSCDISLTYHKYNDTLKCHYCGYTVPRMSNCEACGSHRIDLKGLGTEKIEDELTIHFPDARVLRLDLETTRSKHGFTEIIQQFQTHDADIMVGTQMLSKGLDFPLVSLVGVINADQLLHFPDFRAHERAYQLLTQVSGRAGRSKKQGHVIIQTNMPQHHVLNAVMQQQYNEMYAAEIEERNQHRYPPFSRIIVIRVKDKDLKTASHCGQFLYEQLHKRLANQIVGPQSPYVSKIKNYYIKEILIKLDKSNGKLHTAKNYINTCINNTLTHKNFRYCIIQPDVDPI
jgi:primosomal protein N' (replication factor Y)